MDPAFLMVFTERKPDRDVDGHRECLIHSHTAQRIKGDGRPSRVFT
jgi:hypothetical protein